MRPGALKFKGAWHGAGARRSALHNAFVPWV